MCKSLSRTFEGAFFHQKSASQYAREASWDIFAGVSLGALGFRVEALAFGFLGFWQPGPVSKGDFDGAVGLQLPAGKAPEDLEGWRAIQ